eukprot:15435013-Alexandrium_andersonii.AAC.1
MHPVLEVAQTDAGPPPVDSRDNGERSMSKWRQGVAFRLLRKSRSRLRASRGPGQPFLDGI